jgi:hypothetical protein
MARSFTGRNAHQLGSFCLVLCQACGMTTEDGTASGTGGGPAEAEVAGSSSRGGSEGIAGSSLGGAGGVPTAPSNPCGSGACCVPLDLEAGGPKLHLINGLFHVEVPVRTGTVAPNPDEYVRFAAEVTLDAATVLTCEGTASLAVGGSAVGWAACSAFSWAGPACGAAIDLRVRLSSSALRYDSSGSSTVCETSGFAGDGVMASTTLSCLTCPAEPFDYTACDFPFDASCPATAYNHWQMVYEEVACSCQRTTPRRWVCPVF